MQNLRITPLDDGKVSEGTWTKYRGVSLKIARAGNDDFNRVFNALCKPYKRSIDKDTLDKDTMKEILCESLAKGILLDWKDLVINGEDIEYSTKNAQSLLNNDVDCRDFVQEFSRDIDNYIKEEVEEVREK